MTDLIDCPICGSDDVEYEFSSSCGYVVCNNCGHEGDDCGLANDPICSVEAAYETWNKQNKE